MTLNVPVNSVRNTRENSIYPLPTHVVPLIWRLLTLTWKNERVPMDTYGGVCAV